jgi:TrmH family RNA methyltransferase
MHNFGFSHLRVVNPYEVAFREARSAVGAAPLLQSAIEYKTVAEAVSDCTMVVGTTSLGHRELHHPLRRLEVGARLIRREVASRTVALLFGSEKFGLSNDDLSHCHWLMRIPTVDQHESMNLGQAVAVCLYELIRASKTVALKPVQFKKASAEDNEQVTRMLIEALRTSRYINPVVAGSMENKIRRLIRRMNLTVRDTPLWLGMLRQILWKLNGSKE